MLGAREFHEGDLVVYRKTKHGPVPGPRAARITPASHGDNYSYNVDKYWVVDEVNPDGTLLLRTRRGKTHRADPNDINLRHAGLLTRLIRRHRFPEPRRSNKQPRQMAATS